MVNVRQRSMMTGFRATAMSLLLASLVSCSKGDQRAPAESPAIDHSDSVTFSERRTDKAKAWAPAVRSPPYVARFGRASEPVPNSEIDGVISVSGGCVVLISPGPPERRFTPVFPANTELEVVNGKPAAVIFDQQRIAFGKPGLVPGGAIGNQWDLYMASRPPSGCPEDLFGVGG